MRIFVVTVTYYVTPYLFMFLFVAVRHVYQDKLCLCGFVVNCSFRDNTHLSDSTEGSNPVTTTLGCVTLRKSYSCILRSFLQSST